MTPFRFLLVVFVTGLFVTGLFVLDLFVAAPARGEPTGVATPTALTLGILTVSLEDAAEGRYLAHPAAATGEGRCVTGNFGVGGTLLTHTFQHGEADPKGAPLSTVCVPSGKRFTAVEVCYDPKRRVQLDGARYEGATSLGGLTAGDVIYTRGTDARANGSVTPIAPFGGGVTLELALPVNRSNDCLRTRLAKPVCVFDTRLAETEALCAEEDLKIDAAKTPPELRVVLDLHHCARIDGSTSAMQIAPELACEPSATLAISGEGALTAPADLAAMVRARKMSGVPGILTDLRAVALRTTERPPMILRGGNTFP